jgi:excisionase family DNA binding protein
MPITINNITYYRTSELCKLVGISKNTLLRWINSKKFADAKHRDRNGWRLFTEVEVEKVKRYVHTLNKLDNTF